MNSFLYYYILEIIFQIVFFYKTYLNDLNKLYLKKYFLHIRLMTQNNKTDLVEAVLTQELDKTNLEEAVLIPEFEKIINNTDLEEAVLTPEINNLVGDELNKILEAALIPDFEKTLKEKAYKDYLKHQEYLKTYRRKHKEGITIKSRENYQTNEEYRRKTLENQKNRY